MNTRHTESAEMVTQPLPNDKRFQNITSQKFGRLTVVSYAGKDAANRMSMWNCLCDCGANKKVRRDHLRTGETKSCGCYQVDQVSDAKRTHGMSHIPEYNAWTAMKARCYNPNAQGFCNYGGRGISVCQRWVDSFENFFSDMGLRPSKKHSIERRENNSGYSPENCYWGTKREQARNRRNSLMIEFEGKLINLAELSQRTGICYDTLNQRFHRGWTTEEVIAGKRNR